MKKWMGKKAMAGLLTAAFLLTAAAPGAFATETAPEEAAEGLTAGLAGYWTFDGADDAARLKNQAASSSITASVSDSGVTTKEGGGIDGGSVYFSGAASSPLKLEMTAAGQGLNTSSADFTLAAWVKYDADMSTADNNNLFQQTGSGRTLLYVSKSNGKYGTYITANNVAMSTTAPVAEKWHHVTLTWDHATKTMTCYVNGRQEIRQALEGNAANAATDVWIGCHKNTAGQEIKGCVDELRYYTRTLSDSEAQALYTYNGYHEIAEREPELNITVKPEETVRDITPAMFGINHRYHKNGYGTWDPETKAVNPAFETLVKEGGFGSIRWPGGTVSNLFTWKDSIGPLEERTATIAGNNFYSDAGEAPVEPGFGLDEAAEWICDDLKVEMIYVYGMGRGSAQDAADLVEYLNAPNDESNPGGGTDWAAVRAANGHPEPYGVTKFEIGNEFTDVGQNYWATPWQENAAQAVTDYIQGGSKTFSGETQNQYYQHNDRVVKEGDWRADASLSDGKPGEVRYLCYVPVIEDSATIYVNGEEWEIVDALDGQGAANVCTLDYETGKITFGDGTNGNIPPLGQRITAHYSSKRDGFVDYYDAMKAIADEIGLEIKIYSGLYDGLQRDFIDQMHAKDFDDKYDGVIYHPYTGTEYSETNYNDCLTQARAKASIIGGLKSKMDTVSGHTDKEVAVSEFGINHTDEFTKSLGNAIYTANHMIDCVNQGAAYQNRHCLVDFTQGDSLGAWTQSVIQCHGTADGAGSGNEYVSTPSARVFSIFNHMTGDTQVAFTAEGNSNYHTSNGQTVQKLNLYTTKNGKGDVFVLAVNNQKDKAQQVNIALEGEDLTGREIQVWTLTSDSVTDQNTQADPNQVKVTTVTVTAEGEALSYTLPAHSVSSLKLPAPVSVTTDALAQAIQDATAELEPQGVEIKPTGTTPGQVEKGVTFVTQDAVDGLQAAIDTAQDALEAAESQEAVDNAKTALDDAVAAFREAFQNGAKEEQKKPSTTGPAGMAYPPVRTWVTEDGTRFTVETKPDGTKTETVETPDGAKTEKITTPDKAVTITVTDPEGEEVAKIELPAEIPEPEEPFVDVDGVTWAKEAISSVAGLGIVKGVGGDRYDPITPMTRGSLATVLHRLSQGKTDYETTFKDVAKGAYYTEGVAWAAKVKVVTGYTPETFAPDDIITREQLAVMLARYAKLIGLDTTADKDVLDEFVDGDKTGPWAVDGVAWAVKNGILKGKGANDLDPTANVSRAEVAVMLDRFLNLVKYAE